MRLAGELGTGGFRDLDPTITRSEQTRALGVNAHNYALEVNQNDPFEVQRRKEYQRREREIREREARLEKTLQIEYLLDAAEGESPTGRDIYLQRILDLVHPEGGPSHMMTYDQKRKIKALYPHLAWL